MSGRATGDAGRHLGSPTHAVLAPSGPEAGDVLAALGFEPVAEHDGAVELAVAGDEGRGRLLLHPGSAPASGPLAIDVYSVDLAATVDDACRAGATVVGEGHIELGPLVMDQVMLEAGGVRVVVIGANHRRPSRLDGAADDRRTSELHSLVWRVDAIDDALPFWQNAGLVAPFDVPIDHPGVAAVMGLAPGARVRMAMLCDAGERPARFELLEPLDGEVPATTDAGVAAIAFTVDDLDAARDAMPGAAFDPVDDAPRPWARRSVAGLAPGRVRFELWERHRPDAR